MVPDQKLRVLFDNCLNIEEVHKHRNRFADEFVQVISSKTSDWLFNYSQKEGALELINTLMYAPALRDSLPKSFVSLIIG